MYFFKIRFIFAILILTAATAGCQKQEDEKMEIIIPQLDGEVIFVQDLRVKSANINSISEATIYGKANYESYPKWSNDGTKIAYIIRDGDVTLGITDKLKIVDYDSGTLSEWEIGNSKYINFSNQLSWSSDNKTIIFLGKNSLQNTIIYFNTQTGDTIQTHFNLKYNEYCTAIAWHPIEDKIAVTIDSIVSFHHENRIWMIEPFNTTPVKQFKIETGWGGVEYMDWNFDGTKLLYSLGSYGDIFVTDADGSNNNMIPEIYGFKPCWSKNGRFLVYQGPAGLDGSFIIPGLFVTDLNGSFEKLLLKNAKNPDWH